MKLMKIALLTFLLTPQTLMACGDGSCDVPPPPPPTPAPEPSTPSTPDKGNSGDGASDVMTLLFTVIVGCIVVEFGTEYSCLPARQGGNNPKITDQTYDNKLGTPQVEEY